MLESKSPEYTEGIAEVNGIEIFYVRAGEGNPLLLELKILSLAGQESRSQMP